MRVDGRPDSGWNAICQRLPASGAGGSPAMHVVAVLALDGVSAVDLSPALEVFARVRLAGGEAAYEVRVCAPTPEIDAGAFVLRAPWGLDALDTADTIILPGLAEPAVDVPEEVVDRLRAA